MPRNIIVIAGGIMLLTDKYSPNTLNGIIGNGTAVSRLENFGAEALSGNVGRPLMVYGPTGIGKTSAVHALAYSCGFEIIEFNASDYRDAEKLNKVLLPASVSRGLFNKHLLILMDEIDELSKKYDSGAERAILELVKSSKHPIVFIARDFWSQTISFLRNHVEKLEFKKPNSEEITSLLTNIAAKEKRKIDEKTIKFIAERCNGDVRGALNDLELLMDGDPELIESLGARNRKKEVYGVLDSIFLSKNFDLARNAAGNADVDMDMLFKWVDENIPNRYMSKYDLSTAYSSLAGASFFMEKASRTSYYGYLRYASVMMSSGISMSPKGRVSMLKSYSFPAAIRYLSTTKKNRSALKTAVSKLIYQFHSDKRAVLDSYLPLLRLIAADMEANEGKEKMHDRLNAELGLEKEEVAAIYG